ncbi:hypothetical protein [Adhaeribacter soli]|uniref:Uncharacterized protein n=1 Tax=Adhaeribacter soli TaxID=2607655 RepID=A0A5N1J0N6_9BACT|nr:hypothetical protein [Adhaeribacter soli]KAA9340265.1 hypothetical protein F0P94_07925 [Adhaeribacter soli]
MIKRLTANQVKAIELSLPGFKNILEGGEENFKKLAVSVFDHWLTEEECVQIYNTDEKEIKSRREKFKQVISDLFVETETFIWRYKKRNRIFVYPPNSLNHLQLKCDIDQQTGLSGQRYSILLPEFSAIYSEEWDWTNLIWYKDENKIKPFLEIIQRASLHILK